jgi:poly-gamma-glutamate biosynthesis protein PgsC/CapC
MIIIAVGLGMILTLLFTETVGLAAGGVVVPGYIALNLHHPFQIISTILVALATYLIVRIIAHYMLIYGRRLLIISILIGYLIGYATKLFPPISLAQNYIDISTIGFVIPGLIAYWFNRQGILETLSAMIIVSVLVRLIIIVITGGVILP